MVEIELVPLSAPCLIHLTQVANRVKFRNKPSYASMPKKSLQGWIAFSVKFLRFS